MTISIILLSISITLLIFSVVFSYVMYKRAYYHSMQSDMMYELLTLKEEEIEKLITFFETDKNIRELIDAQLEHPMLKIILKNLNNLKKQLSYADDSVLSKYSKFDKALAEELKQKSNQNKRRKRTNESQSK